MSALGGLLRGVYLVPGGGVVCSGGSAPGGVPGPRGCLLRGGVCSGGGYLVWGVSAPGGCLLLGVYLVLGGVPGPGGMSAPGGAPGPGGYVYLVPGRVGGVPGPSGVCTWSGTPPCGQTDACKLITLPETSFAGGNKN